MSNNKNEVAERSGSTAGWLPCESELGNCGAKVSKVYQHPSVEDLPALIPVGALWRALYQQNWRRARRLLQYRNVDRLVQYEEAHRWTVLKVACYRNAPSDVIGMLLEANPDACLVLDGGGLSPVHWSRESASDETIIALLDGCPQCASIRCRKFGRTALHWAIRHQRPPSVIRALLETDPSVIHVADHNGETPLRRFFGQHMFFISTSNEELLKIDEISEVLLHVATYGRVDPPFPGANLWFVLHASIKEDACPAQFVHFLSRRHSQQVTQTDENGNLPLHLILTRDRLTSQTGLFVNLFGSYPAASSVTNKDGRSPLHIAALCGGGALAATRNLSILQFLIEKDPRQASKTDEQGNTPLHLVCAAGLPCDELSFEDLFRAFPDALSLKNKKGLTPLDLAFLRAGGSESESISSLVVPADGFAEVTVRKQVDILGQKNLVFQLLVKDPSWLCLPKSSGEDRPRKKLML